MRTPLRTALRLALFGCLGLAAIVAPARAAEPEKVLPDSTLFFFKVKDVAEFREAFKRSQLGQMLADPAVGPMKEGVVAKVADASKELKAKLGVTLNELLSLPQGPATVAVISKNDPKLPISVLITADAGKNEKQMTDVMMKSTKQAEDANAKVGTESFKGLTLHVVQPPKDGDKPNPPLVWTNSGSVFHISSDIDAIKDCLSHADGRPDSLGSVEAFAKTKAKLADAPVSWFFDINKGLKLLVKAAQAAQAAGGNNAGAGQNIEAILQSVGINGLKAASGTFTFNQGPYDRVSKVFFLAPAPTQGILKMFSMPQAALRPEPWVPASASTYQTLSWDLDKAYDALNDLVNNFQPGMLNLLEQQMVGANGGEPLSLQKDIFGPLGDRMTLVSDFKKPITPDGQRLLLGVALEDPKAFGNTLNKLIGMAGGAPAKRDFQGTTVYDFKLPEMPATAGPNPFKNGISLAIAKDTLFVASDPAALENVLRGGGSSLADDPKFQEVAKQLPSKTSSLTYAKAEDQARVSYEMLKNGDYEKAFKNAPNGVDLSKIIDKSKLPDFSVFAKYLSDGGGFGQMEDDGVTFTTFSLRKANP